MSVDPSEFGLPPETPPPRAPRRGITHWVPFLAGLRGYGPSAFRADLVAGIVLSTIMVPAAMGYAQAAGLPAITGLYATVGPLVAYFLVGPSRVFVIGPDSALIAPMAATIVPLAGGDAGRSVALAAALAIMVGAICVAAAVARLGFLTDLLSRPVRIGYMNGIALTVIVSQVPKLLGFSVSLVRLPGRVDRHRPGGRRGQGGARRARDRRGLAGSDPRRPASLAAHPGRPPRGRPRHARRASSSGSQARSRWSATSRAASRLAGIPAVSRGRPPGPRPRRAGDRPARVHRHERQLPDVQRPPRGIGGPGPGARRAGHVQHCLRDPRRVPDQQ